LAPKVTSHDVFSNWDLNHVPPFSPYHRERCRN
jgi:hypothetical protein